MDKDVISTKVPGSIDETSVDRGTFPTEWFEFDRATGIIKLKDGYAFHILDNLSVTKNLSVAGDSSVVGTFTSPATSTYSEAVDMSIARYTQSSIAKKQIYTITTGAGSQLFNCLSIADLDGCRVRCVKSDTGAGVATIDLDGVETFLGGATAFPLRKQGDYIEFESVGGIAIVIDSLSTLDSEAISTGAVLNTAHGFGVQPRVCDVQVVIINNESNWVAGEVLTRIPSMEYSGGTDRLWTAGMNATNITFALDDTVVTLNDKTTGAQVATPTAANLKMRYRLKI